MSVKCGEANPQIQRSAPPALMRFVKQRYKDSTFIPHYKILCDFFRQIFA